MRKYQKGLTLILSIIFGINSGLNSLTVAKDVKSLDNKKNVSFMSDINKLIKDPDWIKLSNYWKKLNHLQLKIDSPNRFELFQPVINERDKVLSYLNGLLNKRLLSNAGKNYLQGIIDQRYEYLNYKFGMVKCYDMSEMGYKITLKREDLENQYDILERLYKEKKINSETFSTTKKKLVEDLKFIDNNNNMPSQKQTNTELIELLLYLNK